MRFAIFDESTAKDVAPVAAAIAAALTVQLNRDLATYYGGNYAVRAAAGAGDIQVGETACIIVDALPQAPKDVAYHDVDGNEVPRVFLARSQCSSLTSGAGSVSGALSHELVETAVDPAINAWRRDNAGQLWAQEACDPCQENGYEINGISVSNFVLPAYWAQGSTGPYDFLRLVDAPFQVIGGGYAIKLGPDGKESQVFGDVGAARLARKRHPTSRTYQRGVRL